MADTGLGPARQGQTLNIDFPKVNIQSLTLAVPYSVLVSNTWPFLLLYSLVGLAVVAEPWYNP